ncbi:MAG: T9SS type A sorting domain-containing protein, partial [Bacteroidota bacterium]
LFFSPSYNLSIIELSRCGGEFECIGETFSVGSKTYAFARAKSISVGMGEHTTFYYTQKQLENLIKDLERDVVFEVDPTKKSQMETQIRIWKSAIAQNEYEKLMAKKVIEGGVTAEEAEEGWQFENITFAYGSSVEKSYQNTVVNDIEYSQQFSHYTGFRTELETFFGSVYVKLNFDIGYATYAELEDKVEVGETQKTKIHFQDNDPGDSYSVNMVLSGAQDTNDLYQELDDLYERSNNPGASLPAGLGISEVDGDFKYNNVQYINPIFITRGGRTSCPHEPEERAKYLEYLAPDFIANLMEAGYITDSLLYPGEKYRYQLSGYDPEKPDDEFILNYGTFQRDQPGIRIEPRVQRDIPLIAGNRATFDIILENLNLEDTIRSYTLMVDQRTTGAGPTMRLDGERFIKGTPIPLYKGEQLRKKITLRPIEGVYDYEDIVIYLVAGCQFDFGQDLDFQEDIFARDTISAFFKPSCPVASVIKPTKDWIINDQTGPELDLEIHEQLYFFDNHEKIKLQFKATHQSDDDWVDAAVWSRDSAEVEERVAIGEDYLYFPVDNHYITKKWDAESFNLKDGNYHVRWEYQCKNGLYSFSAPINGVIDRTAPHPFGRPSPADGVLSPGDEIVLTLNEPIVAALVNKDDSPENPGIVLKPYETKVYFNYAVSGDKVIITLDEDNPASVENCILDISVENLVDRNGNIMKSPATWSVFVDRNQVTWNDRSIALEKKVNEPLKFRSTMTNSGGETRDFVIDNLPPWLTAAPMSGSIDPDSEQEVVFTVNAGLNIGEYQQPIHLRTSFGFNEGLLLNLKVLAELPESWTFQPEDFQYTMSFIGQIKIKDHFSVDDEDQIAVFVNDSLRGLAPIQYQEVYDNYQAFLSVHSNDPGGNEILEFRIWDASEGRVLTGIVVPEIEQDPILFAQNEIYGRPSRPVTFLSADKVLTTMNLPKGWKWVSFNLETNAMARTRNLFEGQQLRDGDRLLSIDAVDIYDAQNDLWIGNLAGDNLPPSTGGIDVKQGYRVYLDEPLKIQLTGRPVNTLEETIHLYSTNSLIKPTMWNWISFLGQDNREINEALASVQAEDGDIIKSQYAFAIYDPALKWVGNLTYLAPGEGYLIQVGSDQQLTFPENGLINATQRTSRSKMMYEEANLDPHSYRETMNMVVQVLGLDLNVDNAQLQVHSEGGLRGVAQLKQAGEKALYYLTVYGNEEEALDFSLAVGGKSLALDHPMTFTAGTMEGTYRAPVIMNFAEEALANVDVNVYPNPFADRMNIAFKLDEAGFGQIRIFSMDGKLLIDREFIGNKGEEVTFEWDGATDLGAAVKEGTYLLHIRTGEESKDLLLIKE